MNDEVARAKLSALEERVGTFEGRLREALELGKTAVKMLALSPAWHGGARSSHLVKRR